MSQECFSKLCHRIQDNVGPNNFKQETFIHELEQTEKKNSKTMVHLHCVITGSVVSGETKIAILLRLLAGGSYLDISVLFGISTRHIQRIFNKVVDLWFLDNCLERIDGVGYCLDDNKMENNANFTKEAMECLLVVLGLLMDGLMESKILVPITVGKHSMEWMCKLLCLMTKRY